MVKSQPRDSFKEGEEVYFVLKNQSFCPIAGAAPESFYMKGVIHKGEFLPKSALLGTASLGTSGMRGWLELSSGNFYTTQTARSPKSPFVNGYMTDAGFVPESEEIH